MFSSYPFFSFALVSMTLVCSFSHGQKNVIFQDDFNRADAAVVENDWITNGPAALKGNALHFQLDDGEFRPRARRTFAKLEGGSFYVSFRFDWLRKTRAVGPFSCNWGMAPRCPSP